MESKSRNVCLLGQGAEGRLDAILSPVDLVLKPTMEMGRQAGRQIMRRIIRPEQEAQRIMLPMILMDRKPRPDAMQQSFGGTTHQ